MLSNQKILYVAGQEFHTLSELTTYMKQLLGDNNEHLDQFKEFCHRLMDQYAYLEVIERMRPVDDLALYSGDFEFGTDNPTCHYVTRIHFGCCRSCCTGFVCTVTDCKGSCPRGD